VKIFSKYHQNQAQLEKHKFFSKNKNVVSDGVTNSKHIQAIKNTSNVTIPQGQPKQDIKRR